MNIESQVISLELAKRLHELGVKQDGYFCWFRMIGNDDYALSEQWQIDDQRRFEEIAAFTASELGELLPNGVVLPGCDPFDNYRLLITKFITVSEPGFRAVNNYRISYTCDSTETHGENAWLAREAFKAQYDPCLANAMAMMLVYLVENGLVKTLIGMDHGQPGKHSMHNRKIRKIVMP